LRRTYLRVFPLVLLGATSHWAGVGFELVRRRRLARAEPSDGCVHDGVEARFDPESRV
jgi:hypothetical protein